MAFLRAGQKQLRGFWNDTMCFSKKARVEALAQVCPCAKALHAVMPVRGRIALEYILQIDSPAEQIPFYEVLQHMEK